MPTTIITPAFLRLAFVHEWSDKLIEHIAGTLNRLELSAEGALDRASKATEKLCLSELRGDLALGDEGAKLIGFASSQAILQFQSDHPMLSSEWNAQPALHLTAGTVVATSMTEVVIEDADGKFLALDRAKGASAAVETGETVTVSNHGRYQVVTRQYSTLKPIP